MLNQNNVAIHAVQQSYCTALVPMTLALLCLASLTGCATGGSGGAGKITPPPATITDSPVSTTINITSGGTYTGTWISNDPSVPAVQVNTDEPVIIQNSVISSRGNLIVVTGSSGADVTIRNVTGTGLDPAVAGMARGVFLKATAVSSLVVQNCSMTGTSFGIWVGYSTANTLMIDYNTAIQLDDRASDGNGGFQTTRPLLGHFIQVVKLAAPNGADIGWNQLKQTMGQSSIEDPINIYLSQGTSTKPIWVHDNYMDGYSSAASSNYSGTGVIADGDVTGDTAYILLQANDMVHTSGGGVAIANGHDVTAQDNRVVSCGKDLLGNTYTQYGVSAVTLWNYYNGSGFYNNKITTTAGGLVALNEAGQLAISDINAVTVDTTDFVSNNNFTDPCMTNGVLNPAAEDEERAYWATKLLTNSILLGDQH